MADTAAYLVDHVLLPLALRQWILSRPKWLPCYFRQDKGPEYRPEARAGAVAFIHRCGTSPNRHTHFHVCVIDGVFKPDPQGTIRFIAADEPDVDDAEAVQAERLPPYSSRIFSVRTNRQRRPRADAFMEPPRRAFPGRDGAHCAQRPQWLEAAAVLLRPFILLPAAL